MRCKSRTSNRNTWEEGWGGINKPDLLARKRALLAVKVVLQKLKSVVITLQLQLLQHSINVFRRTFIRLCVGSEIRQLVIERQSHFYVLVKQKIFVPHGQFECKTNFLANWLEFFSPATGTPAYSQHHVKTALLHAQDFVYIHEERHKRLIFGKNHWITSKVTLFQIC